MKSQFKYLVSFAIFFLMKTAWCADNVGYVVEKAKFKDPPINMGHRDYRKEDVNELTKTLGGYAMVLAGIEAYLRGEKKCRYGFDVAYPPTKSRQDALKRQYQNVDLPKYRKLVQEARAELTRRHEELKKVAVTRAEFQNQLNAVWDRLNGAIDSLATADYSLLAIRDAKDFRLYIDKILSSLKVIDESLQSLKETHRKKYFVYSVDAWSDDYFFDFFFFDDINVLGESTFPEVKLTSVADESIGPALWQLMMQVITQQGRVRLRGDRAAESVKVFESIKSFKYSQADAEEVRQFKALLAHLSLMMGLWSTDYFIELENEVKNQFSKISRDDFVEMIRSIRGGTQVEQRQREILLKQMSEISDEMWAQVIERLEQASIDAILSSGFGSLSQPEQIEVASILKKKNSRSFKKIEDNLSKQLFSASVSALKANLAEATRREKPKVAGVYLLAIGFRLFEESLLEGAGVIPQDLSPALNELAEPSFEAFDMGMQILASENGAYTPEIVFSLELISTLGQQWPAGRERRNALLDMLSKAIDPKAKPNDEYFLSFFESSSTKILNLKKELSRDE